MSGYLLDTNVVSLFAPDRPPVSLQMQDWLREQDAKDALYVSAITVAEIQRGIKKLELKGAHARAAKLMPWLSGLVAEFDSRILSVDADVAMTAGVIEDHAEGNGHRPGLADVLIAATASVHDLTVATLNTRHFAHLGVAFITPDDIQVS